MKKNVKLWASAGLIFLFVLWTVAVNLIDLNPIGPNGSIVGFSTVNGYFHNLTGVNFTLYTITDWLGLVPFAICLCFGVLGFAQMIARRSVLKVDTDILILGVFYILVIAAYLFFEKVVINYRPVLINGILEASYPSSTTLLVLSVMPTLVFQARRRLKNVAAIKAISILTIAFSVFMVAARLVSGVHWLTDIVGAVLLSAGMFLIYRAAASKFFKMEVRLWNFMKNFRN